MIYLINCRDNHCELCKARMAAMESELELTRRALAMYETKLEPAVMELVHQAERDRAAGEMKVGRDYVGS
jgi:hypothetical protein